MNTIPQIKAAIKSFQNDTNFLKLRLRWNEDFDLYRKKPYDAGSGYYSYTTALPRILINKAISMVTESKTLMRIPEDTLRLDERFLASNVERLLYGMVNLYDERMLQIDEPSFKEKLAWHAVVRGGFAVRPFVYKNEDSETIMDFAVWDLYNTAYGMGANGTRWAANTRQISKEQAEDEWKVKLSGKPDRLVDIIDFWDTENNGVIVDNEWGKKLKKHGRKRCPVYIIRAGAMPQVSHSNYDYSNTHIGESILAGFRSGYPMMSKLISDYATIVRRGVKVPLVIWSSGGKKSVPEDVYKVEHAATIQLDSNANEKIEPLIQHSMPNDAAALLAILSNEEQLSGMSHIALGQLSFRLSGFAVNTLVGQILEVVTPFLVCVEKGIKVSCLSALEQYSEGSFPPLAVRGRTSRNQPFGMPEAQVITPQDVRGNWRPEIKLIPTLPKDDAQRWQLAEVAKRTQLMSTGSIQDALLGIEDPDYEKEKMDREWANNLILNKLYDAYMAAVVDRDFMKAENVRMELVRVMQMQGAPAPGKQPAGGGMTERETEAAGMPGVGMPLGETGMPASLFPPEMGGGMPPGAMNARIPVEEIG